MKKPLPAIASDLFSTNHNCAQSVLMAFAEKYNISPETAFSLAAGFGGGIARTGQVCGAVSGAVMVLGLHFGQPGNDPSAAKELTAEKVTEFLTEFKTRTGGMLCRELVQGIDLTTAEGRKQWNERDMHGMVCEPAVRAAVAIIEEVTSASGFSNSAGQLHLIQEKT